jgi:putative acetyltransferase
MRFCWIFPAQRENGRGERGLHMPEKERLVLPVRRARADDFAGLKTLYQEVAKTVGAILRTPNEITDDYIRRILDASLARGLILVAHEESDPQRLLASIHAYRPEPKAFSHVLSNLTIVVHPLFQGKGVGRLVFSNFLDAIKNEFPTIYRVELLALESYLRGLLLYETLGFVREGRLESRVRGITGEYEAEILMAWFNPECKV